MHTWIMNLGSAVIQYFQSVSDPLLQSLKIAGVGMLGIFVVIGIVILSVTLLNRVFSR